MSLQLATLPPIYRHMGVRLACGLDVERLRSDIERVLQHCEWIERVGNCWHAVPLRSYQGGTSDQHVLHADVHYRSPASLFADTTHMQHCPYICELVHSLGAPLYKVRLMKMDAHSTLEAHVDTFRYANTCRLAIVAKSHPNVTMTVGDQCWHLEEGSLWFANVRQRHSVQNNSDVDRIHIVFDVEWCATLDKWYHAALSVKENVR